MLELTALTTAINLFALAASLWLGFYIITRSPHAAISRLAALLLWTSDTYFLSNALWNNLKSNVVVAWMLQLALFVLPLMLHLSFRLSPILSRGWTRWRVINVVSIPLAYATAGFLMLAGVLPSSPPVGLFNPGTQTPPEPGPLGYVSQTSSPFYSLFLLFLILTSALSLFNLWQARARTRNTVLAKTYTKFLIAVALVGVGSAYSGFGTWLRLTVPTFPADILFGTSICLVGYAVARHAALLEGRLMERDFAYALVLVGSFTAVYVLIGWIFYFSEQASFVAFVLFVIGTIAANSLLDSVRIALDRVFYQRQFQRMRGNLRALAREAGTSGTLAERLNAILASLCNVFHIRKGFIALARDGPWVVQATHDANPLDQVFENSILSATESVGLLHSGKKDLTGMLLLIPLLSGGGQVGAIVLGDKQSRQPYSEAELQALEDLADQIAGLIYSIQLQEENARVIDRMVQEFREKERDLQLQTQKILAAPQAEHPPTEFVGAESLLPLVEDALRKFHDLAYLGEHPLAKLRVIEKSLRERNEPTAGHIERGKAVSEMLMRALNQLRPNSAPPAKHQTPPREWHPFIILHDSYVLDEPNRDIMSRLFVGEGTFNRTRRRALTSLAKLLAEMEQNAVQN